MMHLLLLTLLCGSALAQDAPEDPPPSPPADAATTARDAPTSDPEVPEVPEVPESDAPIRDDQPADDNDTSNIDARDDDGSDSDPRDQDTGDPDAQRAVHATGTPDEPPPAEGDAGAPPLDTFTQPTGRLGPRIDPGDPAFIGPPSRSIRDGLDVFEPPPVTPVADGEASSESDDREPPLLDSAPAPSDDVAAPGSVADGTISALRDAGSALVPKIVLRGVGWGFLLTVLGVLTWVTSRALSPLRDRLAEDGLIPGAISALQHTLRIITILLILGAIAAVLPKNLEPALPIIVIAAAAAVGWSLRDLLPDLVAGVVIAAERRVRSGQWISTAATAGIVVRTALRSTHVRDATGRLVSIPNRMLLKTPIVTDKGRWPTLEIELLVSSNHPPSAVRRVIEDAVLVSPWAAPVPAQMIREEQEPGRWRVRVRILASRFADRFEGGLREHVEEVLERGSPMRS